MSRASRLSLPPGCVTGIGSLPFTDPVEAVEFVSELCPVLPWWPQLPARSPGEGMLSQALGAHVATLEPDGTPFRWRVRRGAAQAFAEGLEHGEVGLKEEAAAGFFAFERAVESGRLSRAVAIKAQVAGPVTLAGSVFVDGSAPGREEWLYRLAGFVARQAVWQVTRLRRLGKPVVMVLDEPALGLAAGASPDRFPAAVRALATVVRAIRDAGGSAGLHCCAPLPARMLAALDLDWISFDAYLPIDEISWRELAGPIVSGGGALAFGLVPTEPGAGACPVELLDRWRRLAAPLGEASSVARSTVITATCGLGLATPAVTHAVFDRCAQLGQAIASESSRLRPTEG